MKQTTFKQVPQAYILKQLIRFWGNMVKNFQGDVQDDDFFDVLVSCFDHDKAIELVRTAYSEEELKELCEGRSRRRCLDLEDPLDDVFQQLWNRGRHRETCRVVLETIRDCMLADIPKVRNEVIERRFLVLKRVLGLSDLELDLLLVAYVRRETVYDWPIRLEDRDKPLYFAMAIDRSYTEVMEAMSAKGRLRKFNLLDESWDYNCRVIGPFLDGSEDEPLERRFYDHNTKVEILPWDFYGDLATKDGAVLKRMLASKPGRCNILLYGAPGTGKTSFARSLAKELGLTAWEIRQGGENGRGMNSESRMMGIQVCQEQERAETSLMIVDEADELLRGNTSIFDLIFGGGGGGKSTEKGVMNSILDEMRMPAVWISNTPAQAMDASVRRRFDYSICFEELSHAQRVSIWRNIVAKLRLGRLVPEARIADYASKYATNAGGIATVLGNVKRMKPTKEQVDGLVETLMKPHCKLMGVKADNRFLPAKDYSLEGLSVKGKVSPERIVKAVGNYLDESFSGASEDRPRMNVLMYGPPGTGKTEFVKYLGKTLDRKVMVMKGSDLMSKYVGESEQNIAAAFRRAETEHAILFFDEIDGLVQSRERARASWEVTQVNELLQQMENFDGVMVAATNFCKNLDPAIMRRFTFKLEFGYLDEAGAKAFFERSFKTTLTPDEAAALADLKTLAPGDFRTVRQELYYLDAEATNMDRIAALKEECAHKPGTSSGSPKIGF